MRLLITTQAVDRHDPALGFFHDWLREFAGQCSRVTVVSLRTGEYDLPENVEVYSLGKERRPNKLRYVANFYRYLWTLRRNYDAVLVHMNPEYVVLGGLLWRCLGKTVALWYVHRAVNLKLRIATALSHIVFSASPEGFRIPTPKANFIGHGIDVARFNAVKKASNPSGAIHIVSVGRITPIKHCETLIGAAGILNKKGVPLRVSFVGEPVRESDEAYAAELREQVEKQGLENLIHFRGGVSYAQMPSVYEEADVAVNMVPTGGYDKAVIEAMASGTPVITSNEGYAPHLAPYADQLVFKHESAEDLSMKIADLRERSDRAAIGAHLKQVANTQFTIAAIVARIINGLTQINHVRH